MKRIYRILICLLLVVAIFALVSCDKKPQPEQLPNVLPDLDDNQMSVVIKNGDDVLVIYVVTLGEGGVEATTAEEVLEYLKDKCGLALTWQDSEYGKFLTAIGGITAEGSSYVEVFTSNTDFQGTWAGVDTIEVGDVTLVAAAVGVTTLGVKAGDIVYFELGVYSY